MTGSGGSINHRVPQAEVAGLETGCQQQGCAQKPCTWFLWAGWRGLAAGWAKEGALKLSQGESNCSCMYAASGQ